MKCINFIIILTLIGMLTGCGPIYETQYDFIPPKSDMSRMCTAQCVQSRNSCEQSCRIDTEDCRARAQENAMYEFERYRHDRKKDGMSVDKSVSDFDRGYSCNSSCNCGPTYRDCYSACGGQVLAQKVCVAFCDKQ